MVRKNRQIESFFISGMRIKASERVQELTILYTAYKEINDSTYRLKTQWVKSLLDLNLSILEIVKNS